MVQGRHVRRIPPDLITSVQVSGCVIYFYEFLSDDVLITVVSLFDVNSSLMMFFFITVVSLFDAMTECQELHPDPEDEDSDVGEEYGKNERFNFKCQLLFC